MAEPGGMAGSRDGEESGVGAVATEARGDVVEWFDSDEEEGKGLILCISVRVTIRWRG